VERSSNQTVDWHWANHGLLLNRVTTETLRCLHYLYRVLPGQVLRLTGYIGRVEYLKLNNLKLKTSSISYPDENAFSYVIKIQAAKEVLSGRFWTYQATIDPRERHLSRKPIILSPLRSWIWALAFKKNPIPGYLYLRQRRFTRWNGWSHLRWNRVDQ
jgi:hypothetical protein